MRARTDKTLWVQPDTETSRALYHKTKDILHVMRVLGHRSIQNTLVYTQLIDFQDEDFTSKAASDERARGAIDVFDGPLLAHAFCQKILN
jgi:hypothetical protein